MVNHELVKNTRTWISWKRNIILLWNKKLLNLCLRWHILRKYRFLAEVTFKVPEHDYIFSNRNLNILGIFWACYTTHNFPIFSKYEKLNFPTSIEIKIDVKFHVSNQTSLIWNLKFFNEIKWNLLKLSNLFCFLKANIHKYTNVQTVI